MHALRVARSRQLQGRLLRPVRRLRFPDGSAPGRLRPLPGLERLWRSPAFESGAAPDLSTRLGRFRSHYGDDVLEAARQGDEARARVLVESWIDANPPRRGDAWHPYPLSTRVGNWIAAATLVPGLASQPVADSIWRQLRRLEHNVEDDILGNHVIRNARALALGAATFGAPHLGRRSEALLRRELPEQVLPDGGHYERSPVYHLVVLRDLLEIRAALELASLDGPIERMQAFAAALARPDGRPALFNDGGLDLAPQLELPGPPEGLQVFPESGFAVVRDGPLWLAFRCGQAAPDFLPAHAHADALSIQLWWDGQPVLADAGSYTYEPGPDRDWFRGTRAHSTVCIDGRDQFRLWGSFRTGPLPRVELHEARHGVLEAGVTSAGIRHVRRVEWKGNVVGVLDRLEGRGAHSAESRLAWAPEGRSRAVVESHGMNEPEVGRGWLSERFGDRSPVDITVAASALTLPAEIGWTISLRQAAGSAGAS